MRAPAIPAPERLFSLVLALVATEQGLTKAEILSHVQGYRQRYARAGDNASLERQFERDKDDLRELGIPVETVDSPDDPGNNQLLRYRIARGDYELPREITFTPDEAALLALAATAWREGSLGAESQRAVMKLRSLGVETTEPTVGFAPRIAVRDAAFDPLSQALERGRFVRFDYLRPGDAAPRPREVAPRALVQHGGNWHVLAEERSSGHERTYLLSRIVGPVHPLTQTTSTPPAGAAERALAGLDALAARNRAVIEVAPGSDAELRLGKRGTRDGDDRLVLRFTDRELLADELASFGPEVRVVLPDELRMAVRTRHERVLARHEDRRDT